MFFLPPWHDRKLLECVASDREDGSRTDLCEKVHQVLDRMSVEVGNQFDDVVSKRRVRKGFAQPVEFLDLSFPRERVPEAAFIVGLLAIKVFPPLVRIVMRVPSSRGYLAVRISSGWISTLPSSACTSAAPIRNGSSCAGPTASSRSAAAIKYFRL